jgi:hypothetical protein
MDPLVAADEYSSPGADRQDIPVLIGIFAGPGKPPGALLSGLFCRGDHGSGVKEGVQIFF